MRIAAIIDIIYLNLNVTLTVMMVNIKFSYYGDVFKLKFLHYD